MLLGLGYGCRIRIYVRHGYCLIFVSFSISLKDRSIIPMSKYVSDTGTSWKMKSPSNIGFDQKQLVMAEGEQKDKAQNKCSLSKL